MTIAPERRPAHTGSVLDLPDPGWAWRAKAACIDVDPELFTITGNAHPDPDAVEACDACPVRQQCLVGACRAGDTATYRGGMTPAERHRWVISQGLKPAGFVSDASQKPLTRTGPRRDIDTAAAVALHRQGNSYEVIGRLLGCSSRTAQRRVEAWAAGLPTPDMRQPVTTEQIAAMRADGSTIRQIAGHFKMSPTAVADRLSVAREQGLLS